MSLVTVGAFQTRTINQSENDSVSFQGIGTLNIAGSGNPIDVTLSQVAGVGLLDTINITNANVTLGGVVGVSALVNYNIGSGGTLRLASTADVAAGSTVTFTGSNSELALGSGLTLGLLNGISSFVAGSTIDSSATAASVAYSDNSGTGTGGTLTLLDSGGHAVAVLPLITGEYVAGDFQLSSDGSGGTLVKLGVAATGVTATPGTASLNAGKTVKLSVATTAPVTVSGGIPTLALNDGGTAVYDPITSSANNLVFTYTVAAGQNTPDLAVTGVSLNGSTLTGNAGLPVDLSGAVTNPSGTLNIDTTAPTVTGATVSPNSGNATAGQTVIIDLGTSENVGVAGGTPTLLLNDGGTATFDPNASTPTSLVFTTTVQPGQSATALGVTGVSLNGATISDGSGNAADMSGAIGIPSGTVSVGDSSTSGGSTGGGTTGGGTTGGSSTGGGSVAGGSTGVGTIGVYRFFDGSTGTHFFTADASEKNALMNPSAPSYRSDLTEEVNNFGAIDPAASDPNEVTVYRFFDTTHGTHFFTANQAEANGLRDTNSSTYRPDLIFEAGSSFEEHGTQQAGDVAVYRFFDKTYGTHFYTGSQSEYAAITTPGTATFRADLVSEGVGFYAPSGSYS